MWHNTERNEFAPRQYPSCEQFQPNTIGSNLGSDEPLERILSTMLSNKAPGVDKISVRVLKDCLEPILPACNHVYYQHLYRIMHNSHHLEISRSKTRNTSS